MGKESNAAGIFHWATLAAALALLNASLTFENVWPTLAIKLNRQLSAEAALCVLGLVLARRWLGPPSNRTLRALAVVWVLLVAGRYAEVTSRSLYGRDINLYWDVRLMPDVGAMFAFVLHPWLVAPVLAAGVAIPLLVYAPLRWSLGFVNRAAAEARGRRVLAVMAGAVLLLSVVQRIDGRVLPIATVADPVARVYAREAGELVYELSGAGVRALPPPASIASDLSRVHGADVFVIFMESYGAVSWQRPEFIDALAPSRQDLDAAIRDTGRHVVSGLVESTTFGGESWLAHLTLLSGTEVRDQDTTVRLMAQQRDTMVKVFGRGGYRTVAIMPGIQRNWPEGAFYGFDKIYGAFELDYQGPPFGWWDITDQFALAKIDALEVAQQPRAPLFVVFPTISTHAPFTPAPPYQPDWTRMLTAKPHDDEELDVAWNDQPDWLNLSPSYVKAMIYANATIGGYLRLRGDRDLVVVLIGDHQPPALVSGEGASWDVPVHVITGRRAVLDRLQQHGFREGLPPHQPRLGKLSALTPILLDAFGD